MAKAEEITGLDCEANVLVWANEVLRVRFQEVIDKRGAAIHSEDIEGVHDMRVATRRLRSALRDFSPLIDKKPLKKFEKDLKNIADALGEARDEDVAIVALQKLRKKSGEQTIKNGIAAEIEKRKTIREKAQLEILEKLSVTLIDTLKANFESALEKSIASKKSKSDLSFNQAGKKVVGKGVKEFCALSENIYEPFIDEPLHKFRIAAKRLRYAIELYENCWGEKIKPFGEGIAEMQGFLGEIHDADVWLEALSEKLLKSKNSGEKQTGIWLLSEFVEKRTKNYRAALKLWSDWQKNNFIENLKTIISQR